MRIGPGEHVDFVPRPDPMPGQTVVPVFHSAQPGSSIVVYDRDFHGQFLGPVEAGA